jgi:hypothetical protein
MQTVMTRIYPPDLERLTNFAEAHNLTNAEAIRRLLDLSEAFPNLDTLPRPEGGKIVPVIEVSHD